MAGPIPSLASGNSSMTAAAMMCAAEWRIVSSRAWAPASRRSSASDRISSASIAMRRRVAPSDGLELLEGLIAGVAVVDGPAQGWAEGIVQGRVARSAVGAGRLAQQHLQ